MVNLSETQVPIQKLKTILIIQHISVEVAQVSQ